MNTTIQSPSANNSGRPGAATVLTTWAEDPTDRAVMAKRWTPAGCQPYDKGFGFTSRTVDFSSIERMAPTLLALASDPHSCVIRGAPHAEMDPTQPHWRRTKDRGDEERHSYEDVARTWVLLDIDGRQWTADPRQGAYAVGVEARANLPEPWRSAACVARLSSSAGMKPTTGVHLWCAVSQPVTGAVLRPYLVSLRERCGVDPALAGAVQPHYTADPIFDGITDPIPRGCRMAVLEGTPVADVREVVAYGQRQHAIEMKAAEIRQRERTIALLKRRMSGRPEPAKATCEDVAEHAKIVSRRDGSTFYCDCRVHGSRSGESLHVDLVDDCWYCHGCSKGGNAWDLATHLLSAKGAPTKGAIIDLLKVAARG